MHFDSDIWMIYDNCTMKANFNSYPQPLWHRALRLATLLAILSSTKALSDAGMSLPLLILAVLFLHYGKQDKETTHKIQVSVSNLSSSSDMMLTVIKDVVPSIMQLRWFSIPYSKLLNIS